MPKEEIAQHWTGKHKLSLWVNRDQIEIHLSHLKTGLWEYDEEADEEVLNKEEKNLPALEAVQRFRDAIPDAAAAVAALTALPKKKDGSLFVNRLVVLHRGHFFSYEDESYYGNRVPELRIKSTSDTTAEVEFLWTTDKW